MVSVKKSEIIIFIIILISFGIGIYFYNEMPKTMASHWNISGQVDGYMPKFFGLFLMPLISVFLFLLFILIPKIDPLKENIQKFRSYYDGFIITLMLFLFYIYLLTIAWNMELRFDLIKFLTPAFGILFYCAGILTEKAKRNWFIGIRTPWTLYSDNVWGKTHRIGGKLFKLAGVISFVAIIFPAYAMLFILVPVIFISIYTVVYSYFEYRNEARPSN